MTAAELATLTVQLKSDEGYRSKPYQDAKGKTTIGWGYNLSDDGLPLDIAQMLLDRRIEYTLRNLSVRWPAFLSLDGVRQQAIANLAYNLGVGGLMTFTRFRNLCEEGDWIGAGADLETTPWFGEVGARGYRIQKMIVTGDLPSQ
jgi:lysozyme